VFEANFEIAVQCESAERRGLFDKEKNRRKISSPVRLGIIGGKHFIYIFKGKLSLKIRLDSPRSTYVKNILRYWKERLNVVFTQCYPILEVMAYVGRQVSRPCP
jgi:hypothetical protein